MRAVFAFVGFLFAYTLIYVGVSKFWEGVTVIQVAG
jgi:hypothetical protein